MNYGKALIAARTSAGLTQRQLAAETGLTHSYLAHIEAGRKKPSLDALEAICRALGLRVSEFCKIAEEQKQ